VEKQINNLEMPRDAIRVAAIENRRLDPQTPKWGLKSEKRIICGNYKNISKNMSLSPL